MRKKWTLLIREYKAEPLKKDLSIRYFCLTTFPLLASTKAT
jgi:hypothetical protein